MATDDRASGKKDELLGKAKKKYAEAINDERWQKEGQAQQKEGRAQQRKRSLKQAGDKLREAFRK